MRLCATCPSARQRSKVKTPTGITLLLDSYQYGRRWVSSSLGCIAKLLLVIHAGVFQVVSPELCRVQSCVIGANDLVNGGRTMFAVCKF